MRCPWEEGQTMRCPWEKGQKNNDLLKLHIKLKCEQYEPH
jgi:hypothetical protein